MAISGYTKGMKYSGTPLPRRRFIQVIMVCAVIAWLGNCAAEPTGIAGYEAGLAAIRQELAKPAGQASIRAEVFEISKDLSHIAACASRYLMSADRWLEQKAGRPDVAALAWNQPDRARANLAWRQTRAALFAALDIQPQKAYGTTADSKQI